MGAMQAGNTNKTNNLTGPLCVIASAVLFGLMPLMTRTAYEHGWNAFTASGARFLIGGLVLVVFLRIRPTGMEPLTKKDYLEIFKVSLFFFMTPVLLFSSYNYIGAGLATTIHFIYPVFVVAAERVFYRVPFTRRRLMCLALCLIGMLLIYTPGGEISLTGIVIAAASGLCFAMYIVIYEHSPVKARPALEIAQWFMLMASAEIFIITILLGKMEMSADPVGLVSILCLAVFAGALASVLFQVGIRMTDGVKASLLSTFEPLTGVVIGLICYREALTARSAAGMAAILLSSILLVLAGEKKG